MALYINQNEILSKLKSNNVKIKEFGVLHIGLFGSYVRNEMRPESDIDILVEFMDGKKSFLNYMNLKIYLEDLFFFKIDLVLKDSVKDRIKDQIIKETIYAA